MSLAHRIGNFFIFIGIFLVGLFIYMDSTGNPVFAYIATGIAAILLGMLFRWLSPSKPPADSGRFRVLKKGAKKSKQE